MPSFSENMSRTRAPDIKRPEYNLNIINNVLVFETTTDIFISPSNISRGDREIR